MRTLKNDILSLYDYYGDIYGVLGVYLSFTFGILLPFVCHFQATFSSFSRNTQLQAVQAVVGWAITLLYWLVNKMPRNICILRIEKLSFIK